MLKKVIEGADRYEVWEDGSIVNRNTGNRLNPIIDKNGYNKVTLYVCKGNYRQAYVHKLVAEAFVTKPESEVELSIYHKDRNKSNNRAGNLGWKPFDEIVKDYHKKNVYKDHYESLKKQIYMINPTDNFATVKFNSFIEAAIYLKSIKPELPDVLSIRSNISAAMDNNRSNYAYGYMWRSSALK